jgi:hypothetical protein
MKIIVKPKGIVLLVSLFVILISLIIRPSLLSPDSPSDTFYLYADAVKGGWTTQYSGVKDLTLNDSGTVFSGRSAIRLKMQPWEDIKFSHGGLDVSQYDRLVFRVNAGKNPDLVLRVHGSAKEAKNAPSSYELVGPMPADMWITCTVPLTDLDVAGCKNLDYLSIQEGAGKPTESFYLDDVYLLRKGVPDPDGTICLMDKRTDDNPPK